MKNIVMYINPSCSNCKSAVEAVEGEGYSACKVEYLKNPLDRQTLTDLAKKLEMRPKDFIRTKESIFESLHLDLEDDYAVIDAMIAHPILIQRPIVVVGEKAFIGRGPSAIQEILEAAAIRKD